MGGKSNPRVRPDHLVTPQKRGEQRPKEKNTKQKDPKESKVQIQRGYPDPLWQERQIWLQATPTE